MVKVFFLAVKEGALHLKLSIITDEISQDLDHALRVCQDLGVSTVELRSIADNNIVFHDEASLSHIKASLDNNGFRVCVIDSPFLKSHLWTQPPIAGERPPRSDFDTEAKQWQILERSFTLAHYFGTPLVRTFSFWRMPDPLTVRDDVLDILGEATRRTQAAGLQLAIENEHACNIATGAEVGWLLQRLPANTFGALWDPGNEAKFGSTPFPAGYEHVRGRVLHMHIKDVNVQGHFATLGSGMIDYAHQFHSLAEDGYQGVLSLETHYKALDGSQEQATRESFAALRKLLQDADITAS